MPQCKITWHSGLALLRLWLIGESVAGFCQKPEAEGVAPAGLSHDFKRDDNLASMWHGRRALGRGLASTLYGLRVDDVMVRQILRHKDVRVTRDHCIKTSNEQSITAMAKSESALGGLCADRALLVRC